MKYAYLLCLFVLACNPEDPGVQLLDNGGFETHDYTSPDMNQMVSGWRPIGCSYAPGEIYVAPSTVRPRESVLTLGKVGCGVATYEYDLPQHSVEYLIKVRSLVITGSPGLPEDACQGVDVFLTWFSTKMDKWGLSSTYRICPSDQGWRDHEFPGEVPSWARLVRLSIVQKGEVSTYLDDVSLTINP